MASIQHRTSRGRKYWSIVESRRINGKPRTTILEYLGTADILLKRLQSEKNIVLKSYRHGDVRALLHAAEELNIINTINRHILVNKSGGKHSRDGLSVGSSFLLAAIGRACHPTSKMAWSTWSKETSLEYCLRASFAKLDSQHFWDQMHALPVEAIPMIEEELVASMIKNYRIKPDCLFFDTTNFFTFIDSTNTASTLAKRGKNKQKRFDLRQIGMALLVTRREQLPLFHTVYDGNKSDSNVFKDEIKAMLERLRKITDDVASVTIVFDKGNNSKNNFSNLGGQNFHYVASLVPSHFKELITEANQNFSPVKVDDEEIMTYRTIKDIWGEKRTCVCTISALLKEGQIRGILECLKKKYKELDKLKQKLTRATSRVKLSMESIEARLSKIAKGQFVENLLKFTLVRLGRTKYYSFDYSLDDMAFASLQANVLGRKIMITNRHEWATDEIIKAYRGQSKVEYAFRTLKNPYHLAVRPQYHWTDQKIKTHFFICIIAYILTVTVYMKARAKVSYKHNVQQLMDDLGGIRLSCLTQGKGSKVSFQLEAAPDKLQALCKSLGISNNNIRSDLASQLSVTTA